MSDEVQDPDAICDFNYLVREAAGLFQKHPAVELRGARHTLGLQLAVELMLRMEYPQQQEETDGEQWTIAYDLLDGPVRGLLLPWEGIFESGSTYYEQMAAFVLRRLAAAVLHTLKHDPAYAELVAEDTRRFLSDERITDSPNDGGYRPGRLAGPLKKDKLEGTEPDPRIHLTM